jgi:CheY-like chemotaxis protein
MANKRILIIDDEPSIREIVHLCLREFGGYEVVEAASGQEGLLKAIEEHPDAIVLDLCMPEMDGIEVLQRLQAQSATLSIPVVVLSAIATLATPMQTLKDNVAEIIPKPFNPLTLSRQIATACHWT